MNVQILLREKAGSKLAARVEGGGTAPFGVKQFVANFDVLAEAEGGIARLRWLVMHLGVMGKLCEPNLSLQPAVDLALEDSTFSSPHVGAGDDVLEAAVVPANWAKKKLGALVTLQYGKSLPKKARNHTGTVPAYGSNGQVGVHDASLVNEPCIIVGRKGSSGAVNYVSMPCWPIDTTYFVTATKSLRLDYLFLLLRVLGLERFDRSTAIPGLNRADAHALTATVPPLAEQKRIVAKVDQLMALCDELEARQTKKRETGARLTKSALEALTSAEGPEEFERAWTRVVENFEIVVDRAEKVGELRRAVLELAVRGRLVPASGTPADVQELENQIATERASMLEGRRKGGRGSSEGPENEASPVPYELPKGWTWRPLVDIAGHIVDGTHHTPRYVEKGMDFISAKDIRLGNISFDGCRQISREEFDELTKRCRPKRGDVLVTKSGSIGEVAIVSTDRPFTLFESVALIPVVPSVNSQYAAYVVYLGASGAFGAENQRGVAVRHLHLVDLRKLPFPLPPRHEQDAIVAKVEQLMKICDDLEAKLRRAEDRAARLVEAVVKEMVA